MLFSVLLFPHLLYGVLAFSDRRDGHYFNYKDLFDWGDDSIICTTGENQSPIDLRAEVIGQDDSRPPIQYQNYNARPQQVNVIHNGHTVELHGNWQGNTPEVTGPVVLSDQNYIFNHFHHHWSTDNNNGTEHSINGKKYAAEVHLVNYNKKYQSISQAIKQPDGLMVIGVLYYVDDSVAPNPGMKLFATYAESVRTEDSTNTFSHFDLPQLLPNPVGSFYSYSGSLTTPPCSENVRWIIMAEPQPINTQIINAFRNLTLSNGDTHNIRPLQDTNNRLVEFYKQ